MTPDLNSDDDNPYDFIFRDDKSAPAITKTSGPNPRQMLVFGGFVIAVLIALAVAFSFISASTKDTGKEAIGARAYQSEMNRIFEIGDKNAKDSLLVKKIATLRVVLLTDTARLDSIISAKGVAPTELQLGQQKDSKRDTALSGSLQTDRHDEVYEEIVDKLVADYYASLKAAQGTARTTTEREVLALLSSNVEILYAGANESPDDVIIEEAEEPSTEGSSEDTIQDQPTDTLDESTQTAPADAPTQSPVQ